MAFQKIFFTFLFVLFAASAFGALPPGERCTVKTVVFEADNYPMLVDASPEVFSIGDLVWHSTLDGVSWKTYTQTPIKPLFWAADNTLGNIYLSGIQGPFRQVLVISKEQIADGNWEWTRTFEGQSQTTYNLGFLDGLYRFGVSSSEAAVLHKHISGMNWSEFFSFPSGSTILLAQRLQWLSNKDIIAVLQEGSTKFYQLENGKPTEIGSLPEKETLKGRLVFYEGSLYAISAKDDLSGGSIWSSADGAKTWQKVYTFSSKIVPANISAGPKGGVFVSTTTDRVVHSWDGKTWKNVFIEGYIFFVRDMLAMQGQMHNTLFNGEERIQMLSCDAFPNPVLRQKEIYTLPNVPVTLDANSSYDFEGDKISYSWLKVSGPIAELETMSGPIISFVPKTVGTYVFKAVLRDNVPGGMFASDSSSDTVTVVVSLDPPVIKTFTANAGQDKTCTLSEGCQLEGTVSGDHSGSFRYLWEKSSGPSLNWVQNSEKNAVFIPQAAGIYVLKFTVEDNEGKTSFDEVQVSVPAPEEPGDVEDTGLPVLSVPSQRVFYEGQVVSLKVEVQSGNVEGLSFSWRQLTGEPVQLSGQNLANPSFLAKKQGVYSFEATATTQDGKKSLPVVVTIDVKPIGPVVPVDNAIGGFSLLEIAGIAFVVLLLVGAAVLTYFKLIKKA